MPTSEKDVRGSARRGGRTTSSASANASRGVAILRVRRVAVSALEAASSVEIAPPRRTGRGALPATPMGLPKHKTRLQQTPSRRSARKASLTAAAVAQRTPAEIQASFDRLVAATAARRASTEGISALHTSRRRRSRSTSESPTASAAPAPSYVSSAQETASHRQTRSAVTSKTTHQQPGRASPAPSDVTLVLEPSDDADSSSSNDKRSLDVKVTPPLAKRPRPRTDGSTAVRSSKRLQTQQRLLAALPHAHIPLPRTGDTTEDEELRQIQKRLVFGSRKAKSKPKTKRTTQSTSPRERLDAPTTKRLLSSVSVLEAIAAPPRSKRRRADNSDNSDNRKRQASRTSTSSTPQERSSSALVLSDWTLQWPLTFTESHVSTTTSKQLQVVLEGNVRGHNAAFSVARRKSATKFESTTGVSVTLDGAMDAATATAQGVPPAVIALFADGLPTQWRQKLMRQVVAASKPKPTRKPTTLTPATERAIASTMKTSLKQLSSKSEPEPEQLSDALSTPKRSRSGRILTPVKDWWRLESSTPDATNDAAAESTESQRGRRTLAPVMEWWRNERLPMDASADPASPVATTERMVRTPQKPPAARALLSSTSKPPRPPPATHSKSNTKAKRVIALVQPSDDADGDGDDSGASSDTDDWTDAQLQALAAAKMQIPTTAHNFWADVASFVSGKSARECRTKSFEAFASPTSRRKAKRVDASAPMAIPTKLHRAGSNLFKKQVRTFVQQYEAKHVDDLFTDTTPSKAVIAGASGLDDIQSPVIRGDALGGGRADDEDGEDEDEMDDDDVFGSSSRRELLRAIPLSKRDEVDSYVLSLKRSHVLSGVGLKATTATTSRLPKTKKRTVHMVEAIGGHRVEGVVSPGGTTHVRIDKDSDATSDEDEEARNSDSDSDAQSKDDAFF